MEFEHITECLNVRQSFAVQFNPCTHIKEETLTFCWGVFDPFSPTLFLIVAKMSLPKRSVLSAIVPKYQTINKYSAMAERPRELGDFKKARVNGGTNNHSLMDSHKCLRCRWQTRIIYGNQTISSTRPSYYIHVDGGCDQYCRRPSDV